MTIFCASCGNPIEDGHRFCENCGASAPVTEKPAAVPSDSAAVSPVPSESVPAQSPYGQVQSVPEQNVNTQSVPEQNVSAQSIPAQSPYSAAVSYPPPSTPIFNAGTANKTNGLAIASLVLGILSVTTGFFFVGAVFGIIAIILYVVARKKYGKSGIGLGGLITGIVGTVISLFVTLLLVIGIVFADDVFSSIDSTYDSTYNSDDYMPVSVTKSMIEGEWHLESSLVPEDDGGEYEDCVLTYDQAVTIAESGEDTVINFKKDGSYVLSCAGFEQKGKWELGEYFVELIPDDSTTSIYAYYYDYDDIEELTLFDGMAGFNFVRE